MQSTSVKISRFRLAGSTGVKNLSASAGDVRDLGSIPGSGSSPGVGTGDPLQYSCLENITEEPGRLHSMESQGLGHD